MKIIKHCLSDQDRVQILPLGDLHIGDKNCDKALIRSQIDYILNTPGCYTILLGDLIDNATTFSIGDTYEEELSPMDQLKVVEELFRPLADAGKILAVLEGNHEERTTRQTGLRMMQLFTMQLGLPEEIYADTSAVIFIKFGSAKRGWRYAYSIYCNHGSGGGRKPGGKINRLSDYSLIGDFDLFLTGHTHFPAVFKQSFYRPRTNTGTVELVEKVFVNIASSLKHGGYGDRQGFTPASNSYPIITLYGHCRKVDVQI